MKLLVCGKGGSGKSTVSALLAKSAAKRGYRVLVIDGDESNFGLHRQLGMDLPEDFMNYFGGKKKVLELMRTSGKYRDINIFDRKWRFDDIPREYLSARDGISLLAVGKIHEFGEGCACPMGVLSTGMLEHLETGENEIVIVDTDAGVEHFGRGVERGCDIVIVVMDPTYESLMLSKKIEEMADSIKKPVYFVLNKVDEESKQFMTASIDSAKLAGVVPMNRAVFQACLRGEELELQLPEIDALVEFLLKGGR